MKISRNTLANIGGLTIIFFFATGQMKHIFFPWHETSPGIFLKVVKYPFGESKVFTIDRRSVETWHMNLPCPTSLRPRQEARTTQPSGQYEVIHKCNGRTLEKNQGLNWHWWFLDAPPYEEVSTPQTKPTHKA